MRVLPLFFALWMTLATTCGLPLEAQQTGTPSFEPVFLDPTQVTDIAGGIAKRSEHLKPILEQVNASAWAAKGAPEAYVPQWASLRQQNDAIIAEMADITQHPEAMTAIITALFRVHRFDSDLNSLLGSVRRYQNPALADLIESVFVSDQNSVDQLQRYVLNLAAEKEQQLSIEDSEAQRCRSTLAAQPARSAPTKKTNGTSK